MNDHISVSVNDETAHTHISAHERERFYCLPCIIMSTIIN